MARKNRTPRMTCTGLSRNVKSMFRSLRPKPEPQPEPNQLDFDTIPNAMDLLAEESDDDDDVKLLTFLESPNDEFDKLTEEIYSQPESEEESEEESESEESKTLKQYGTLFVIKPRVKKPYMNFQKCKEETKKLKLRNQAIAANPLPETNIFEHHIFNINL